eukprot:TRINITY_DN4651_c0_g1_i1.p1 TRINITY_DN4651_c0_g1~~TRINITY_DN4651_c0_g1_i1.p1  ORF type:complete len:348 (+),score=89.77 TRINITY_DN4651_c0_g1_i1:46-1089(+)
MAHHGPTIPSSAPDFVRNCVDLLSSKVGGKVLGCSDQWFAPCDNMIQPSVPIFIPDKYVDTGKWMDGWETRRHNPAFDWAVLKLGIPGYIQGVEIDTAFFTGNYPPNASLEALCAEGDPELGQLLDDGMWTEILAKVDLGPGQQHFFATTVNDKRWTHLRFKIYPDGGVARLRVYGVAHASWGSFLPGELIDLAAIENGGVVVGCSDMYFGNKNNIIMPGRSINMGDGWETKRRRGPGYDWLVAQLGAPGLVKKVEVDTNWFKGNFPTSCSLEVCWDQDAFDKRQLPGADAVWRPLLPNTPLRGHQRHFFRAELTPEATHARATHVRLNIFPDGGVSRLRIHCYLPQ